MTMTHTNGSSRHTQQQQEQHAFAGVGAAVAEAVGLYEAMARHAERCKDEVDAARDAASRRMMEAAKAMAEARAEMAGWAGLLASEAEALRQSVRMLHEALCTSRSDMAHLEHQPGPSGSPPLSSQDYDYDPFTDDDEVEDHLKQGDKYREMAEAAGDAVSLGDSGVEESDTAGAGHDATPAGEDGQGGRATASPAPDTRASQDGGAGGGGEDTARATPPATVYRTTRTCPRCLRDVLLGEDGRYVQHTSKTGKGNCRNGGKLPQD